MQVLRHPAVLVRLLESSRVGTDSSSSQQSTIAVAIDTWVCALERGAAAQEEEEEDIDLQVCVQDFVRILFSSARSSASSLCRLFWYLRAAATKPPDLHRSTLGWSGIGASGINSDARGRTGRRGSGYRHSGSGDISVEGLYAEALVVFLRLVLKGKEEEEEEKESSPASQSQQEGGRKGEGDDQTELQREDLTGGNSFLALSPFKSLLDLLNIPTTNNNSPATQGVQMFPTPSRDTICMETTPQKQSNSQLQSHSQSTQRGYNVRTHTLSSADFTTKKKIHVTGLAGCLHIVLHPISSLEDSDGRHALVGSVVGELVHHYAEKASSRTHAATRTPIPIIATPHTATRSTFRSSSKATLSLSVPPQLDGGEYTATAAGQVGAAVVLVGSVVGTPVERPFTSFDGSADASELSTPTHSRPTSFDGTVERQVARQETYVQYMNGTWAGLYHDAAAMGEDADMEFYLECSRALRASSVDAYSIHTYHHRARPGSDGEGWVGVSGALLWVLEVWGDLVSWIQLALGLASDAPYGYSTDDEYDDHSDEDYDYSDDYDDDSICNRSGEKVGVSVGTSVGMDTWRDCGSDNGQGDYGDAELVWRDCPSPTLTRSSNYEDEAEPRGLFDGREERLVRDSPDYLLGDKSLGDDGKEMRVMPIVHEQQEAQVQALNRVSVEVPGPLQEPQDLRSASPQPLQHQSQFLPPHTLPSSSQYTANSMNALPLNLQLLDDLSRQCVLVDSMRAVLKSVHGHKSEAYENRNLRLRRGLVLCLGDPRADRDDDSDNVYGGSRVDYYDGERSSHGHRRWPSEPEEVGVETERRLGEAGVEASAGRSSVWLSPRRQSRASFRPFSDSVTHLPSTPVSTPTLVPMTRPTTLPVVPHPLPRTPTRHPHSHTPYSHHPNYYTEFTPTASTKRKGRRDRESHKHNSAEKSTLKGKGKGIGEGRRLQEPSKDIGHKSIWPIVSPLDSDVLLLDLDLHRVRAQ